MRLGEAGAFARDFLTFRPRSTVVTCILVAASGLVEGLALALVIPLLQVVELGGQSSGRWVAALNAFGAHEKVSRIAAVLVLFSILMLVRTLLVALRETRVMRLELEFIAEAQVQLVERLGSAPWSAVVGLRHARVNRILGTDMMRVGQAAAGLIHSIVAMITLAVQLAVAVSLNAPLTGVALAFVAAGALLSRPLYMAARRVGEAITEVDVSLLNQVGQFLGSLKLAVSQNLSQGFVDDFSQTLRRAVDAELSYVTRQNRTRLQMTVTGLVVAGGTAFVGLGLIGVSPPVLVALLLLLSRMSAPMQSLQSQALELVRSLPAYGELQLLKRELETDRRALTDAPLPRLETLTFDDVGYHHRVGEIAGLAGMSIALHRGEFLGLAGPSGAGKTTFADLLVGLYEAQSGRILLNGVPVSLARHRVWRDQLAYVSQDPFMRNASVRENLLWANPAATPAAIERALMISGGHALVTRLPEGLDTLVGERGSLLSGGERQRLALARALLRDPNLLILDEATNAIDVAGERDILNALRAECGDMVILMIAHRLESMRQCDRIVLIEAGRVVQEGSFDALRSKLADVERDVDMSAAEPETST